MLRRDASWLTAAGGGYQYVAAADIEPVRVIQENQDVYRRCLAVLKFFFTTGIAPGLPLKGFLLEGPPGTGKTELVFQVAREASTWSLKGVDDVFLLVLDGATIASPRWGEAESLLRRAFDFTSVVIRDAQKVTRPRVVILFDDIESLMLARSSEIAKEWHFSINSVLFHKLDQLYSTDTFVFATTNRPDLVDDALRDRLYVVKVGLPSIESLLAMSATILESGRVPRVYWDSILSSVENQLRGKVGASIREAQRLTVLECIERGMWEA